MNCKQGELAFIVKGRTLNIGKIVKPIRLASTDERSLTIYSHPDYGPLWLVETHGGLLINGLGELVRCGFIPDSRLRPIRPIDTENEKLTVNELGQE